MKTTALILALLCGVTMAAAPEPAADCYWLSTAGPVGVEVCTVEPVPFSLTVDSAKPCESDIDCFVECVKVEDTQRHWFLMRAYASGGECHCEWGHRITGQRGRTKVTCRKVPQPVKP